jgi:hypothetical protein
MDESELDTVPQARHVKIEEVHAQASDPKPEATSPIIIDVEPPRGTADEPPPEPDEDGAGEPPPEPEHPSAIPPEDALENARTAVRTAVNMVGWTKDYKDDWIRRWAKARGSTAKNLTVEQTNELAKDIGLETDKKVSDA